MIKRLFFIFILFHQICSTAQTVTDIDGNVYPIVSIGKQVWMAENLRVKRFSNGDTILSTPNCYDTITDEFEPKYWWAYSCNDSLGKVYGLLYTWYVAVDDRNVCADGWHVPSRSDFMILEHFLGGSDIAGGKLKSTGTATWLSPNTGATNEYDYSGVGNGHRSLNGYYNGLQTVSDLWSTTEGTLGARDFDLHHDDAGTWSYDDNKEFGFAIRCLRDEPSDIEVPNDLTIISIYPNPVINNTLTINALYNSNIEYQIISLDGKVFLTGFLEMGMNEINIQTLASGMYIVQLVDKDQKMELKFNKD